MNASDRQERLRMRQRGAGTRKIDAVDFGISFDPTPRRSARNTPQLGSQRRQSRTPLTARGAPRRPSKTPSKGPKELSNTDTSDQGSAGTSARPRPDIYDAPEHGSETRSRKRRKLSAAQENAQLITPVSSSTSAPNPLRNQSISGWQSSALSIEIAEDSEQTQPELDLVVAKDLAESSLKASKENAVLGSQSKNAPRGTLSEKTPKTGKSTVYSRQTRASRSSSRQSDNISILSANGDLYSEDEVLVAVLEDSESGSVQGGQEGVSLMTAPEEVPDETMELVAVLDESTFNENDIERPIVIDPTLLAEEREELSAPRSANIKKKRSSLKTPGQQSAGQQVSYDVHHPSSEISAEQIPLELSTPSRAQSTASAHPCSDDSFYQPHHNDEDETYLQPSSPANPTPKPITKKPRNRKAATKATHSSTSSSKTQSKRRKGKPTTFPILTHRLTNTSALPTITEETEEDNSDAESGSASAPKASAKFYDRPTPNAADVLAQFCREDIEAAIENLGDSTNTNPTPTRAELKRQRLALQSFNRTLETRLFSLSAATEHRLSLEARVKKALREKAETQARWIEVRRQREKVAASLAEVRQLKEEREKDSSEVRGLSDLLWRVEQEVERGEGVREKDNGGEEDKEKDGLEWKIRTVADRVSGTWGGGLLEQVREFNGVLERMVGVLDSRKTT